MKRFGRWLMVGMVVLGSTQFSSGEEEAKPVDFFPWSAPKGGPTAELSLYVIRPYFTDNAAFTTTNGAGTGNPSASTTDYPWNFSAAPAISFGWVSECGLGIRAHYFNFADSSGNVTTSLSPAELAAGTTRINAPVVGLPTLTPPITFGAPGGLTALASIFGAAPVGDHLSFNSHLRVDVWDLEGQANLEKGPWLLTYFLGGRYLNLTQQYGGTLNGSADTAPARGTGIATESQTLSASHDFIGGGPTTALQAKIHLLHGLSVYGNARGSLLFGRSHETASFTQSVTDPSGILLGGIPSSAVSSQFSRNRQTVLPVAEIDVGLEYGMKLWGTYSYARTAVVNETYFGAGSASHTDGNFGLFGVQFTVGVDF